MLSDNSELYKITAQYTSPNENSYLVEHSMHLKRRARLCLTNGRRTGKPNHTHVTSKLTRQGNENLRFNSKRNYILVACSIYIYITRTHIQRV